MTDQLLANWLMIKITVVHQRINGYLHKVLVMYYQEGCGNEETWNLQIYHLKRWAEQEQNRVVLIISVHTYISCMLEGTQAIHRRYEEGTKQKENLQKIVI